MSEEWLDVDGAKEHHGPDFAIIILEGGVISCLHFELNGVFVGGADGGNAGRRAFTITDEFIFGTISTRLGSDGATAVAVFEGRGRGGALFEEGNFTGDEILLRCGS